MLKRGEIPLPRELPLGEGSVGSNTGLCSPSTIFLRRNAASEPEHFKTGLFLWR